MSHIFLVPLVHFSSIPTCRKRIGTRKKNTELVRLEMYPVFGITALWCSPAHHIVVILGASSVASFIIKTFHYLIVHYRLQPLPFCSVHLFVSTNIASSQTGSCLVSSVANNTRNAGLQVFWHRKAPSFSLRQWLATWSSYTHKLHLVQG